MSEDLSRISPQDLAASFGISGSKNKTPDLQASALTDAKKLAEAVQIGTDAQNSGGWVRVMLDAEGNPIDPSSAAVPVEPPIANQPTALPEEPSSPVGDVNQGNEKQGNRFSFGNIFSKLGGRNQAVEKANHIKTVRRMLGGNGGAATPEPVQITPVHEHEKPADPELLELAEKKVKETKGELERKIYEYGEWRRQRGNENKSLKEWVNEAGDYDEIRRRAIYGSEFWVGRVSVDDMERYKKILSHDDFSELKASIFSDLFWENKLDVPPIFLEDQRTTPPTEAEVSLPGDREWGDQIHAYLAPEMIQARINEAMQNVNKIMAEYSAFRQIPGNEDKNVAQWLSELRQVPLDQRPSIGIFWSDSLPGKIIDAAPQASELDKMLQKLRDTFPNDPNLDQDVFVELYERINDPEIRNSQFPEINQKLDELYAVWRPQILESIKSLEQAEITQGRQGLEILLAGFSKYKSQEKKGSDATLSGYMNWLYENNSEDYDELSKVREDLELGGLLVSIKFTKEDLNRLKEVLPKNDYQQILDVALGHLAGLKEDSQTPHPLWLDEDVKWINETYAGFKKEIADYEKRRQQERVELDKGILQGHIRDLFTYLSSNPEALQKFNAGQSYLPDYVVDKDSQGYIFSASDAEDVRKNKIDSQINWVLDFNLASYLFNGEVKPDDPLFKTLEKILLPEEYEKVVQRYNERITNARIEAGLEKEK